jgi:hypothetical protein
MKWMSKLAISPSLSPQPKQRLNVPCVAGSRSVFTVVISEHLLTLPAFN